MGLILPFRPNPLTYPGGRAGINPAHPASQNCCFSAVPITGTANYVNLLTGARLTNQQGSQTNALTPSIDTIGPALSAPTGAQSLGITFSQTVTTITLAAIFRANYNASFDTIVAINKGAGGSFWLNNGRLNWNGVSSTLVLTVGAAYFAGVSSFASPSGTGLNFTFFALNLNTGQMILETIAPGTTWTSFAITDIEISSDGFNEFSPFPMAAGMLSNTYLNPRQLLQWAQNPWAFWYPPSLGLEQMLGIGTAAPPATVLYELMNVG